MCPFDYTAVAGSGKEGTVNRIDHTSRIAVVTPSDRYKSVRNRCEIELFGGITVLILCACLTIMLCRGFCLGLSQISSFFLSQLMSTEYLY